MNYLSSKMILNAERDRKIKSFVSGLKGFGKKVGESLAVFVALLIGLGLMLVVADIVQTKF